jgi:hypothetical protein
MVNVAKEKEEFLCKYNLGIGCDEYEKCGNCGWNPEVNEKRRDLLHEVPDYDTGGDFDE